MKCAKRYNWFWKSYATGIFFINNSMKGISTKRTLAHYLNFYTLTVRKICTIIKLILIISGYTCIFFENEIRVFLLNKEQNVWLQNRAWPWQQAFMYIKSQSFIVMQYNLFYCTAIQFAHEKIDLLHYFILNHKLLRARVSEIKISEKTRTQSTFWFHCFQLKSKILDQTIW